MLFFRMLRKPSATMASYNPRSLVENLQLSFSLELGATSPSRGAYYPDGRHFFFDVYEPFIRDVEYVIHHLSSLVSLNIFVDMVQDPAAFTRIINMLRGKRVQPAIKPFVLRLKSLSHKDRVGALTSYIHGDGVYNGASTDILCVC